MISDVCVSDMGAVKLGVLSLAGRDCVSVDMMWLEMGILDEESNVVNVEALGKGRRR